MIAQLSQSDSTENIKRALEAVKKICKKYRYMFRSDDLYMEMNYMIENLSNHLMQNMFNAITALGQALTKGPEAKDEVIMLVSITNSVLHIIESILS